MVEQLKDRVFWEIFWDNGGRFLLTLLVIDILLLIGIKIYGNFKNRRNRGTVSSSNRRWINRTTKRRRLFDGMEVLEVNTECLATRYDSLRARFTNSNKGIPVNDRHEPIRNDGVIVDIKSGTIQPIRHYKSELSTAANNTESLSHTFGVQ